VTAAAPPEKGTPSTTNRGRKTAPKLPARNYCELVQSTTFPFCRDGFDHKLIEQIGHVCLVERSKSGRQMHYEMVVLKRHEARQWPDGRFTPAGWHYPSSECWGEAGWTHTDLAQARCRYLSEAQEQGFRSSEGEIAGTHKKAPYAAERRAAA
jgi:hypothetical protein